MLSAICYNLDQCKILLSGNGLTLYHTIQTLNDPKEKCHEKHWKKENAWNHGVFLRVKERNHFSNIEFVVCKCFQFGPG